MVFFDFAIYFYVPFPFSLMLIISLIWLLDGVIIKWILNDTKWIVSYDKYKSLLIQVYFMNDIPNKFILLTFST